MADDADEVGERVRRALERKREERSRRPGGRRADDGDNGDANSRESPRAALAGPSSSGSGSSKKKKQKKQKAAKKSKKKRDRLLAQGAAAASAVPTRIVIASDGSGAISVRPSLDASPSSAEGAASSKRRRRRTRGRGRGRQLTAGENDSDSDNHSEGGSDDNAFRAGSSDGFNSDDSEDDESSRLQRAAERRAAHLERRRARELVENTRARRRQRRENRRIMRAALLGPVAPSAPAGQQARAGGAGYQGLTLERFLTGEIVWFATSGCALLLTLIFDVARASRNGSAGAGAGCSDPLQDWVYFSIALQLGIAAADALLLIAWRVIVRTRGQLPRGANSPSIRTNPVLGAAPPPADPEASHGGLDLRASFDTSPLGRLFGLHRRDRYVALLEDDDGSGAEDGDGDGDDGNDTVTAVHRARRRLRGGPASGVVDLRLSLDDDELADMDADDEEREVFLAASAHQRSASAGQGSFVDHGGRDDDGGGGISIEGDSREHDHAHDGGDDDGGVDGEHGHGTAGDDGGTGISGGGLVRRDPAARARAVRQSMRSRYRRNARRYGYTVLASRLLVLLWVVWGVVGMAWTFHSFSDRDCRISMAAQFSVLMIVSGLHPCFVSIPVGILCCTPMIWLMRRLVARGEGRAQGGPVPGANTRLIERRTKTSIFDADSSEIAEDDALCAICLSEYSTGDEISTLPCVHHFHKACVADWLQGNKSCPMCKTCIDEEPPPRRSVVSDPEESDGDEEIEMDGM